MAHLDMGERICYFKYRIAREEQALLTVSAVLSLIRRPASSPRL